MTIPTIEIPWTELPIQLSSKKICLICKEVTCICEKFDEKTVARRDWNLPIELLLAKLAAEFYLLYDLSLREADGGRFVRFVNHWLPVFTSYTDMVIGGELRHGATRHFTNAEPASAPLVELIQDSLSGNRGRAWFEWKAFRNEHGTTALVWAADCFRCFPQSGIGGPRWASITDQLWYLETGQTTPVLFMDTCWGLEHNGGCYFNKMAGWKVAGLREVLDANLSEDMDYLRRTIDWQKEGS